MIEILFTADKKIHASGNLNFQFQQKELLLVPVNTLRNYTYVPPRRLWRRLSVPSHHQTLSLREEREELWGRQKLAPAEIYRKRASRKTEKDRFRLMWSTA